MLLCLKSYVTYFRSQQTFSPILTCRWKLPCAFKIKKDVEPCQSTVAGHKRLVLAQKLGVAGDLQAFYTGRASSGLQSLHQVERRRLHADPWVCLKGGVRCMFMASRTSLPCSEPVRVQMRKWRLSPRLQSFLSHETCFRSLVPMCSGGCGSPRGSGCAYSLWLRAMFLLYAARQRVLVLGFCWAHCVLECWSK